MSEIKSPGDVKQPEDIKRLREISARLKELGCPVDNLNNWIDKEEGKMHENSNNHL